MNRSLLYCKRTAIFALLLLSLLSSAQVSFNSSPGNGCAPQLVSFTYTGNPSGNYFRWYFGDGDSSHVKNPTHTYVNPGWFSVSLSVWDTTNKGMIFIGGTNNNIQIEGATNFDVSTPSACPGESVRFGFNQGNYNNITWEYGDSTQNDNWNNTSHSFKYAGIHTVKMTVSTSCGTKIVTRQITVSNSAKPVFSIGVNQNDACLNDAFYFSANYPATSYLWDFGDATSSAAENPSHAYTTPGNKRVILTATNPCGGSNKDTLYVNVASSGLNANANFNLWPNPACPNSVISMDSWASGTGYLWDLGDGTTSTQRSVQNFYTTNGNYNVKLIVTNGCGDKDTVTQVLTVSASSGMNNYVNISFDNVNGNPDTMKVCPGSTVNLRNNSGTSEGKYSFLWKFGDGSTATTKNASHKYTAVGNHKVVLIITNSCGKSDSASKIVVVNANLKPNAQLQSLPDSVCPGGKVYFFDDGNHDNNSGNSYSIDFGDGNVLNNITGPTDTIVQVLATHSYATTGTYNFKFYVTNLCGKKDSLKKSVVVLNGGPKNKFYYVDNSTANNGGGNNDNSGCPGDLVKFTAVGGAVYSWNFGDGKSGSGQIVYHSYASAGTYKAKAMILNNCGQNDTIPTTVEIRTTNKPQAWFDIDKTFACSGDTIHFSAEGYYGDGPDNNNHLWDFGDGNTSTLKNPVHAYSLKGVFKVTHTVTNGCGSSMQYNSIIIDKPTVAISGLATTYCSYDAAVTLTGTPSGGTFKIDGLSAVSFNPTVQTPGPHTVTYTYTNTNGCSSTDSKSVTVNQTIANAGIDASVCAGGSAQLNATGGGTYAWLPATNLSNAAIANPVASPSSTTNYTVTVTKNSCVATDVVQVAVAASLTANAGSNTSVCNGNSVTLNGSGGGNYSWAPSASLNNAAVGNPVASPTTTTTYTLTVSSGSCSNTGTVTVTVDPAVTISNITSTNVLCNGTSTGSAVVSTTGGTGTKTYSWSNGGTAQTVSSLSASTYTVTIVDSKGCSNTSAVVITQPTKVNVSASVGQNVGCNGGNNGSASVAASGGSGTYTYNWNTGATGQTISGLTAATYTVTVKDANNCITTSVAVVTQPTTLTSTSIKQDASCIGCSDGSASVFANGGTLPYTYLWTPGSKTTVSVSGLSANTYTACVTDAKGCTSCTTINIGQPTGIITVGKDAGNIGVYPNPNDGSFVILITELNSAAELSVMDVTGRSIYSRSVPNVRSFTESIDLSVYACGTYYARLITSTGSVSVKRIVIGK